jgi:CheY-specific phosphatase CheX
MLAMEPDAELGEEEITDAIGEVTNMIMGSLKSRIANVANSIDVSIPTVTRGIELHNSLGDGANTVSKKVDIANEYIAELSLSYRDSSE